MSKDFYRSIPPFSDFAGVAALENYRPVPDDWDYVVTDVIGSTKAIEDGRYQEINALGVASIVAVRNALAETELPYIFGGDGATLLCPAELRPQLETALRGIRETARTVYDLNLRTGIVPVKQLREAGHEILVARYAASAHVSYAMLAGEGVSIGEQWIKQGNGEFEVSFDGPTHADYTGFECRWQPIANQNGLVFTLLVLAFADTLRERAQLYQELIEFIETTVGPSSNPCGISTLKLANSKQQFDTESRLKSGQANGKVVNSLRNKIRRRVSIGRLLLWSKLSLGGFPGRDYKKQVVANTDFRKFDETLRMVLDISDQQRNKIEQRLSELRQQGKICFGTHIDEQSIMTCAIEQYQGSHVHFVDGAGGGYALAAQELKKQLANRS